MTTRQSSRNLRQLAIQSDSQVQNRDSSDSSLDSASSNMKKIDSQTENVSNIEPQTSSRDTVGNSEDAQLRDYSLNFNKVMKKKAKACKYLLSGIK